jgi:hypothetical protein
VSTLLDQINAQLLSDDCSCLGISTPVYDLQGDGSIQATCASDPTCTPNEDPAVCIQYGVNDLGSGGSCGLFGVQLQGLPDIDLNNDPTVYEGLSVGYRFTTVPTAINGLIE